LCAGFQLAGFGSAGGGIALETGLGLGHCQFDKHGRFHGKYISFIRANTNHHVFFDKYEVIIQFVLADGNLIIGFHIHKKI
jgi:hypothetical protein